MTALRVTGTLCFQDDWEADDSHLSGAGMNRTQTSITAALLTTALLATTMPAAAEQALAHWPRQCRGDIGRICRTVAKEEDKTILTCLQENETKLSQGCRKLLQSYGHVPDNPGKRR